MLPEWCGDYIGLKYKDMGRGNDGYDCWGLVREIWGKEYGLEVPSYRPDYESAEKNKSVEKAIRQGIEQEWYEVDDPVPGDGLVLRVRAVPIHIGLIIEPPKFIHIFKGTRSVIADFTSMRWNQRIVGFYRHERM